MEHRIDGSHRIVISLERGDDLRSSVEGLAEALGVVGASVSAIGALEDPELGYFHRDRLEYERQAFPGMWELLHLGGNLALLDGRPFLHAHVALGGPDFAVIGGHLFEARVGVVAEIFLDPLASPIDRRPDPELGLATWSLRR